MPILFFSFIVMLRGSPAYHPGVGAMLAVPSRPWGMYVSGIHSCLHSGPGLPIGRKKAHLWDFQAPPKLPWYMCILVNDPRHMYPVSYIQMVLGLDNQRVVTEWTEKPLCWYSIGPLLCILLSHFISQNNPVGWAGTTMNITILIW